MQSATHDVLIIGGGPAGLEAALMLGRARKSVAVLDRGNPRHAVSSGVHNFVTREGIAPAALRQIAWEQMAAYHTVEQHNATVTTLTYEDALWVATTSSGARMSGRAALLATGVVDEHPDIPGYQERWGHAIHHCPYCHGWELQGLPLAVLATGDHAAHLAPLLQGWSDDVIVLTHGQDMPPAARERLQQAGIPIHEAPIASLEGPGRELTHISLSDGTRLERRGLFVAAPQHQVELVTRLGVALDDNGYVAVDPFGVTSLPNLWAAGDLTSRLQQVIMAAAQGARAAAAINAALTLSPT